MYRKIVKSVFVLYPGYSLRDLNNKFKLMTLIAREWSGLKLFLGRLSKALGKSDFKMLGVDCIGVVHWPYISSCWSSRDRFSILASHYEVVAKHCPQLLILGRNDSVVLSDLSKYSSGCSLVLDRPVWFMREGELVLNVFREDLRVASIAFSLSRTDGELCIFIGAVQGIHKGVDSETSLSTYRDLTKDFEGLRPRSFLIEVIKCIARNLGVSSIYAVGDGYRHHRHPYFGAEKAQDLAANYDVIWLEHGAIQSEREDFFSIPTAPSRKSPDDISSKKRAMYRRRHELLDDVFAQLETALPGA